VKRRDPIDVFFKSLALTVKQFSPELKIKAKLDILRTVSELELKNNQEDIMLASQVPTRPSTSYEFPKSVRLVLQKTDLNKLIYPVTIGLNHQINEIVINFSY